MITDTELLEAALAGYDAEISRLHGLRNKAAAALAELKPNAAPMAAARNGGSGPITAAGRKRIADAQKKRWAEFHRRKAAFVARARRIKKGEKGAIETQRAAWRNRKRKIGKRRK